MIRSIPKVLSSFHRHYSACGKGVTIAILGAAGHVGQPLSLLLKMNPMVLDLRIQDKKDHIKGIALDLCHIDRSGKISGYVGKEEMAACLRGCDIVVMAGGATREPGMTREDLLNNNGEIIKDWACAVAKCCPEAVICIITNPVNSMVPICAELFKAKQIFNPAKLLGVINLDVVRSKKFLADALEKDPQKVQVPSVCGHTDITILPVLSANSDAQCLDPCDLEELYEKIRTAGTKVLEAKGTTASLSTAYAANQTVCRVINGLLNQSGTEDHAYVFTNVVKDICYCGVPLKYGKTGICEIYGIPPLNDIEKKFFCVAVDQLRQDIQKGEQFVENLRR